jgi:integrase
VLTAIETGMRWGELAALRPRHLDLTAGIVRVEETIVEVSKKDSPTGQRMMVKAYPKDNEPRTLRISTALTEALHQRIRDLRLTDDDLLFASTRAGGQTPMSRNTFRTRAWVPATKPASRASASTTCATPKPPGCSPAAPTSRPSWTASATPRSKPPRNTSTPSPTPTTKALAAFQRTRNGHRSQ